MFAVRVFQTMAWSRFRDVYLLVHAPGIPADGDWSEFIREVTTTVLPGIVVMAGNARLSPSQRADVQRWFLENGVRGSVVTDSALARGVVTALGWFKVKLKAFSPSDLDQAFHFVGVEPEWRSGARSAIEQLERALLENRNGGQRFERRAR
jgi:hypothetical protein